MPSAQAAPRNGCGRSPSLARPGGGRLVSARYPDAEGRVDGGRRGHSEREQRVSETDHRRLRVSSQFDHICAKTLPAPPGVRPGRGESSAVRGGERARSSRPVSAPEDGDSDRTSCIRPAGIIPADPWRRARRPPAPMRLRSHRLPRPRGRSEAMTDVPNGRARRSEGRAGPLRLVSRHGTT